MTAIVCAALSACLFYFSQGLDDAWALAWLAPAPLLWLAFGRAPLWRVGAASFVAFVAAQIYDFQCYGRFLPLLMLTVIVGLQATLFAAAVCFAGAARRRVGRALSVLAFPCGWTAIEYLTSLASPHGSFGSLAYSQMSAPLLIQGASLFGMYAVTFLICLFASATAQLLRDGVAALAPAGAALALCALNLGFGALRLAAPHADTIRVAAVSDVQSAPAGSHAETQRSLAQAASAYASAVRAAAGQGAKLVVTTEGGIVTRAAWRGATYAPFAEASRQTGAEIVAGFYGRFPPEDIAVVFEPDGRQRTYAKRHLLLPLESQFIPGRESGWLGVGRAVVICKDMDFPRTIRRDAQAGIRLMAVPAGDFVLDGWLHGRMAIMRGVENGFAVVRAANDGLLTASDAQGRLVGRKTAAGRGTSVLVADLPLGPGPTPYTRLGDVLPWAAVILTLLIGAVALRPRADKAA